MATRQYIGARYVPKFYENSVDGSTQWEANVVYEPLIYVTLANGHMYISKKQVPATVGTPASNAQYWLDVGSYNGIIEELQAEIQELTNVLNTVDYTAFDGKKILILGDSISDENRLATNWVGSFRTLFPNAIITNNSLNGRWLNQIPALLSSYNFDNYDYVIIFAGINDYANSVALGAWGTGTTAWTDVLRTILSTVQNHTAQVFMITSLNTTRVGSCPLNIYRNSMVEACKYWGARWINGGCFPHLGGNNSLYFMADGLHPDSNYSDIMALYIANKLLSGGDTMGVDTQPYSMDIPAAKVKSALNASLRKMSYENGELHLIVQGTLTFANNFYTAVLEEPVAGMFTFNTDLMSSRFDVTLTQNNEVLPATAWVYNNEIIIQHGSGKSGTADLFMDLKIKPKFTDI